MQKFALIAALLFISSCTLWNNKSSETPKQPVAPAPVATTPTPPVETPKATKVTVNYILRDGSPTGKIIDTNLIDVAKANGLYQSGGHYEGFSFELGANEVVPGFERGVMTMKKGEKKMIEVLPKDGYGEATKEETVKNYEVEPKFTVTTDRQKFADSITETVLKSALGEQGKTVVVGQTLTGGSTMVAKVTKIEGENVTIVIDNKDNPFYGKRLAVGVTSTKDKAKFTVKALTETGITLEVENGNSPFAGKDFVVGAQATLPQNGGTLTVKAINGDSVVIEVPNPSTHPLVGKTLYFEVEVLDPEAIKAVTSTFNINREVSIYSDTYLKNTKVSGSMCKVKGYTDIKGYGECLSAITDVEVSLGAFYSDHNEYPDSINPTVNTSYPLKKEIENFFIANFNYKKGQINGQSAYEISLKQ